MSWKAARAFGAGSGACVQGDGATLYPWGGFLYRPRWSRSLQELEAGEWQ